MRKQIGRYIVMVMAVLVLTGCSAGEGGKTAQSTQEGEAASGASEREIFAMDTYMTLSAYGERAEEALDQAVSEINRLDALFSTGNEESDTYLLNQNGSIILSEDTASLMKQALAISDSTGGAFDITIYPLMSAWGFTTEDYRIPSEKEIKKLLKKVGSEKVKFDTETGLASLPDGVEIDFGGIAKGYTSGLVMDIFREYGLSAGIVSLGGNVQLMGEKEDGSNWKVAVRDPEKEDESDYLGILELKEEKAVITSGGYERYFEKEGKRWHHILDPSTGYPADSGLTSVTIVSDDGTLADGLSTAVFVMGKKEGVAYWRKNAEKFDMVLMDEQGTVTITEGLEGMFTSERETVVVRREE